MYLFIEGKLKVDGHKCVSWYCFRPEQEICGTTSTIRTTRNVNSWMYEVWL